MADLEQLKAQNPIVHVVKRYGMAPAAQWEEL